MFAESENSSLLSLHSWEVNVDILCDTRRPQTGVVMVLVLVFIMETTESQQGRDTCKSPRLDLEVENASLAKRCGQLESRCWRHDNSQQVQQFSCWTL